MMTAPKACRPYNNTAASPSYKIRMKRKSPSCHKPRSTSCSRILFCRWQKYTPCFYTWINNMQADDKTKLLIVDDLPENLRALNALIRQDGLEIYQALSGDDALALLLEHEF